MKSSAVLEEDSVQVEPLIVDENGSVEDTSVNDEIVALEAEAIKLFNVVNKIETVGITKSIVLEAREIVPNFGKEKPLAFYPTTPSVLTDQISTESFLDKIKEVVKSIIESIKRFFLKVRDYFKALQKKWKEFDFKNFILKTNEAIRAKSKYGFSNPYSFTKKAEEEIKKKGNNTNHYHVSLKVDEVLKNHAQNHPSDSKFNNIYKRKNPFFSAFLKDTDKTLNLFKNPVDEIENTALKTLNKFHDLVDWYALGLDKDQFNGYAIDVDKSHKQVEDYKNFIAANNTNLPVSYNDIDKARNKISAFISTYDFDKKFQEHDNFIDKADVLVDKIKDKLDKSLSDLKKEKPNGGVIHLLRMCGELIQKVISVEIFIDKLILEVKSFSAACFNVDLIIIKNIEKSYKDNGLDIPDDLKTLYNKISQAITV